MTPPCPACGVASVDGATYCEACGAELSPAPPCAACGAPADQIAADGYCGQCGHKQPGPRDHTEVDLGDLAAVSDIGRRHHENEDSYAIGRTSSAWIGVVCDGVSSTEHSEQASQAAADQALGHLLAVADAAADLGAAIVDAVRLAADAVTGIESNGSPSCTVVVAVLRRDAEGISLDWGWLGDSRAYLLGQAGVRQLTTDDTFANALVQAGQLAPEEALEHPRAHSITRWLGAGATDTTAQLGSARLAPGERVLLCSDGLWNYAPTEADLAALVGTAAETPLALAQRLCRHAVDAGGHDNVTVVVASPDPTP